MNAVDILKGMFGNNATRSRGLENRQGRSGQQQNPRDLAASIEDILGVGEDRRSRRRSQPDPYQTPPQRRQQPAPRVEASPRQAPQSGGGLGDLLGQIFGGGGGGTAAAPPVQQQPDRSTQEQAVLLIRAMCNAAKVDGDIDKAEQEAILSRLGKVTQDEIDFVRKELASPLDLGAFCRSVPDHLASEIYGFSVMAIALDSMQEAAYLGRLAGGLDLEVETCNQLHQKLGAPQIFG